MCVNIRYLNATRGTSLVCWICRSALGFVLFQICKDITFENKSSNKFVGYNEKECRYKTNKRTKNKQKTKSVLIKQYSISGQENQPNGRRQKKKKKKSSNTSGHARGMNLYIDARACARNLQILRTPNNQATSRPFQQMEQQGTTPWPASTTHPDWWGWKEVWASCDRC